ncbi:unnamed protein product [Lymnaea stagnalis]|uniref:Uncharacterized protein n=1 Tax=Lymnaea stagnalis TaxID=6523 RepID=A0AAV2ICU7_LYMST
MGFSDGMKESTALAKLCFFVVFAATVASWISFTTTSWGINFVTYTGIWRQCRGSDCIMLDGYAKVWFGVFQAFSIIGFMGLNAGCLLIGLYIFWGSCKKNGETGLSAAVICIITSMFWLIAVIIFGAKFELDDEVSGPDSGDHLGFSFGLAVAALGLELIVGVLMLLEAKKS